MKCEALVGFNAAEKVKGRSDRMQVSSIDRGGARGDGDELMETLMKTPWIIAAGLLKSLALLSLCVFVFSFCFFLKILGRCFMTEFLGRADTSVLCTGPAF